MTTPFDDMSHIKRILVYKRTHHGDPDVDGCFGIHDCMGRIRRWDFDAVIGVGGKSPHRGSEEIACKLNWIGIGPHKKHVLGKRGPDVTFDHFLGFGEGAAFTKGELFTSVAPTLAARVYSRGVHQIVVDRRNENEYVEAVAVLRKAAGAPPSRSRPD